MEVVIDREKKLLKLNDALNNKCMKELKSPKFNIKKPIIQKKSTSKQISSPSVLFRTNKTNLNGGKINHQSTTKHNENKSKEKPPSIITNEELTITSNVEETVDYFDEDINLPSDEFIDHYNFLSVENHTTTTEQKNVSNGKENSNHRFAFVPRFNNSQKLPIAAARNPNAATASSVTVPSMTSTGAVVETSEFGPRKKISYDGLIKFLKSKVTILQQELELSNKENIKKSDKITKLVEQLREMSSVQEHAAIKINDTQIQMNKLSGKLDGANDCIVAKDLELTQQNKELDKLKRELKIMQKQNGLLDRRITKADDDLECVKKNSLILQENEKEMRELREHERGFYEEQIKLLAQQRINLITAYKKQLLLLDNLKRQNICLEQTKLTEISEKEFTKMLDWNKSDC